MDVSCNFCGVGSNIEGLFDSLSGLLSIYGPSKTKKRDCHATPVMQENQEYRHVIPPPRTKSPGYDVGSTAAESKDSFQANADVIRQEPSIPNPLEKAVDNIQRKPERNRENEPTSKSNGKESDDTSVCSMPSLCASTVAAVDAKTFVPLGNNNVDCGVIEDESKQEDQAHNVLAWSVLAAVLASPAPSSVLKNDSKTSRKKEIVNLWEDGSAASFSITDNLIAGRSDTEIGQHEGIVEEEEKKDSTSVDEVHDF